jgi:hypothetical protein
MKTRHAPVRGYARSSRASPIARCGTVAACFVPMLDDAGEPLALPDDWPLADEANDVSDGDVGDRTIEGMAFTHRYGDDYIEPDDAFDWLEVQAEADRLLRNDEPDDWN